MHLEMPTLITFIIITSFFLRLDFLGEVSVTAVRMRDYNFDWTWSDTVFSAAIL